MWSGCPRPGPRFIAGKDTDVTTVDLSRGYTPGTPFVTIYALLSS